MRTKDTKQYKTGGKAQNTNNQRRDHDSKPCLVVYTDGDEFHARHHIVTDSVVHVYAGPKSNGITRTIPLSSVRHILRGDVQ